MSTTIKNTLIGLLVVLNLATLGMLWYDRTGSNTAAVNNSSAVAEGIPRKDLLADELGFDKDQRRKLEELKTAHHQNMRDNERRLMDMRKQLHQSIGDPATTPKEVQVLSDSIGAALAAIERSVFDHFRDIRNLCTDEQAAHFDTVIFDLMRQMGPPGRRPGGGPPHGGRPPDRP